MDLLGFSYVYHWILLLYNCPSKTVVLICILYSVNLNNSLYFRVIWDSLAILGSQEKKGRSWVQSFLHINNLRNNYYYSICNRKGCVSFRNIDQKKIWQILYPDQGSLEAEKRQMPCQCQIFQIPVYYLLMNIRKIQLKDGRYTLQRLVKIYYLRWPPRHFELFHRL